MAAPETSNAAPSLSLGAADALFLDYDGSLVEIAATPGAVKPDPALPLLLKALSLRLDGALAVISGRPLAGLARLLQPFEGAAAGIHGVERRTAGGVVIRPEASRMMERVRPLLEKFTAASEGVMLEDKGLAFALHFRAKPSEGAACLELARQAEALADNELVIMQGKMVVELHPRRANKGIAILEFLAEPPFRGRRPVFVGDDRTDEEGFAVVNRLGGVSVHVGANNGSSALFRLPDVTAVLAWLADFAAKAQPQGGDRAQP